jgi:phosphohistidine phosphatase
MAVIGETPEETATLVLVGHNPSIAELADALDDGAGDPASREALTTGYPTSGVCVFTVTGAWNDVRSATLTHFSAPRG